MAEVEGLRRRVDEAFALMHDPKKDYPRGKEHPAIRTAVERRRRTRRRSRSCVSFEEEAAEEGCLEGRIREEAGEEGLGEEAFREEALEGRPR